MSPYFADFPLLHYNAFFSIFDNLKIDYRILRRCNNKFMFNTVYLVCFFSIFLFFYFFNSLKWKDCFQWKPYENQEKSRIYYRGFKWGSFHSSVPWNWTFFETPDLLKIWNSENILNFCSILTPIINMKIHLKKFNFTKL